ncbi:MBL fold metallo-hydrolase [Falsihalocynthiibacter sp. S25ZX9]|uniref:MBL fold metallo-hydrolase n=1 Tax=Falsihalocynthiibacter sp. S25ZX9 TaxID=3240870 RepID=UPI003510ACBF
MPSPPMKPSIGTPDALAADVTRVLAPNPSAMTYWGTNTYLVGQNSLVVIDPGPNNAAHLKALLAAIDGRQVAAIAVTHSHLDHSPLAPILAAEVGTKVWGYGTSSAGRSARMATLAATSNVAGGEGVDLDFTPDVFLADNAEITWSDGTLTALHTPGHFCNHLSFRFGDSLFSGDHVMGWASTLISPPDGDLTQYRASLRRLQNIGLSRFYPGHGAPIDSPETTLTALLAHRKHREAQIFAALTATPQSVTEITAKAYHDTPPTLLFAAARNAFAHLIDLYDNNEISCENPLDISSRFSRK